MATNVEAGVHAEAENASQRRRTDQRLPGNLFAEVEVGGDRCARQVDAELAERTNQ